MQTISSTVMLQDAILALEVKQAILENDLKVEFHEIVESFRPMNLMKNSIKDFVTSPDLKNNLLNAAIGLATGFVSKKVLIGGSHNPVLKLLGILTEFGVAGVVTKNPEGIKNLGLSLINLFFKKQDTEPSQ